LTGGGGGGGRFHASIDFSVVNLAPVWGILARCTLRLVRMLLDMTSYLNRTVDMFN
jgi:hypothetical protein